MIYNKVIYRNNRPIISVVSLGSKKIGNCYHEYKYKIVSTKKLSGKQIVAIYESGIIGVGQSFSILSEVSGSEVCSGEDLVYAKGIDCNGSIIDENPKNCLGNSYKPINIPYYEYVIAYRVDSSD